MRKLGRNLLVAAGMATAAGFAATPALAEVDFRFGIQVGPPAYYAPYRPYYSPYYYNYGPYYRHHHRYHHHR